MPYMLRCFLCPRHRTIPNHFGLSLRSYGNISPCTTNRKLLSGNHTLHTLFVETNVEVFSIDFQAESKISFLCQAVVLALSSPTRCHTQDRQKHSCRQTGKYERHLKSHCQFLRLFLLLTLRLSQNLSDQSKSIFFLFLT